MYSANASPCLTNVPVERRMSSLGASPTAADRRARLRCALCRRTKLFSSLRIIIANCGLKEDRLGRLDAMSRRSLAAARRASFVALSKQLLQRSRPIKLQDPILTASLVQTGGCHARVTQCRAGPNACAPAPKIVVPQSPRQAPGPASD